MKEDYLGKKMKDIEEEVAVAVGVANMIGCVMGKCTEEVIQARDEATEKIQKIVRKLLKTNPTPTENIK